MKATQIQLLGVLLLSSCAGCRHMPTSIQKDSELGPEKKIFAWILQRHGTAAESRPEPCVEIAYLQSGLVLYGESGPDGACNMRSVSLSPGELDQAQNSVSRLELLRFPPRIYVPPDGAYREIGVLRGDRYVVYGWTERECDLPRFAPGSDGARLRFADAWQEAVAALQLARNGQAMSPAEEHGFLTILNQARFGTR